MQIKELWIAAYLAALAAGRTTPEAEKIADNSLAVVRKRWPNK